MWHIKSYLKFFLKVRIIATLRKALVVFFGAPVNKEKWEQRILVMHLAGIGDIVMITGILRHYKDAFPGAEITLLAAKGAALPREFIPGITRVIGMDYRALTLNPYYGLSQANMLRAIGFETVIVQDQSAAEVVGKGFATLLGAKNLVGYEGPRIQHDRPLDLNMSRGVREVMRLLRTKYTVSIKSVDRNKSIDGRLTNALRHCGAIFSGATNKPLPSDIAPRIVVPDLYRSKVRDILKRYAIKNPYIVITLGTSTVHREWPSERFAPLAEYAMSRGYDIVLAGGPGERGLAERFKAVCNHSEKIHDLTGNTSLPEYAALFENAAASLSNCTGAVHIAIALKKPSFVILGVGHLGMVSWYGYSDINVWSYDETIRCRCDNWRCIADVGPHDPMPCLASQSVADVLPKWQKFIEYISTNSNLPKADFAIEIPLPEERKP